MRGNIGGGDCYDFPFEHMTFPKKITICFDNIICPFEKMPFPKKVGDLGLDTAKYGNDLDLDDTKILERPGPGSREIR